MRGHVRTVRDGVHRLIYDLPRGADGERRQKWETYYGKREDADGLLAQRLAALYRQEYVEPSELPLSAWLNQWLQLVEQRGVSIRTWESYEEAARLRIVPFIGHVPLGKLQPLHIQGLYSELLRTPKQNGPGNLSPTTVRGVHRILHIALEEAVDLGLLYRNPCDRVKPPRVKKTPLKILDAAQATTLLQTTAGARWHAPIALAVLAGMREGEILGLRWRDVDLTGHALTVAQTLLRTASDLRLVDATKTTGSHRRIRIGEALSGVLRRHKARQAEERLKAGPKWTDLDLVCPTRVGTPTAPRNVYRAFKQALEKAGLPDVRFHDLRHTHNTLLMSRGIPAKVAAERAGHSSVHMTLDTYSHVLPDMQEAAATILDDLLPDAKV